MAIDAMHLVQWQPFDREQSIFVGITDLQLCDERCFVCAAPSADDYWRNSP